MIGAGAGGFDKLEILGISVCGGCTIIRSNGIETICHQKNPPH